MSELNLQTMDSTQELSSFGFGGWALGGDYWGPQEHKDSVRAIHKALSLGINHFDTAPVYGKGRSEQLIGQQLKKIRSRCIIATKAFYTTPEEMIKSFHTSLKRLLTDYIDIFYIHWPRSGTDMRPGMEELETLRRLGRIRYIGVSNFSLNQTRQVEQAGNVDFFQGGYSILWPFLEETILPYCRARGIRFIPYGVLAQGILTDQWSDKLLMNHPGYRYKMLLYSQEIKNRIGPELEKLAVKCREKEWSVENAVSWYTFKETDAASILLGCRNRNQAEKNFSFPMKALPDSIKEEIEDLKMRIVSFLPKADNMFGHKS